MKIDLWTETAIRYPARSIRDDSIPHASRNANSANGIILVKSGPMTLSNFLIKIYPSAMVPVARHLTSRVVRDAT